MNREIKFRAKRIDMDRWVYGDYFKTPLTDENSGLPMDSGMFYLTGEQRHCIRQEHGVSFVVDVNTLGQYTGLKDKNGKEIYEGDIVSNGMAIFTLEFNNNVGGFWFLGYKRDSKLFHQLAHIVTEKYEIIGNIYEDPELI